MNFDNADNWTLSYFLRIRVQANETKNVDWGCNHVACPAKKDVFGFIRTHKKCCSQCAINRGYHMDSAYEKISADYPFDEKNGWWKYQVGCTLPRQLRSLTCQEFMCGRAHDATSKDSTDQIEKARHEGYKVMNKTFTKKERAEAIKLLNHEFGK